MSELTTRILTSIDTIVKDEIKDKDLKETIQKYMFAQTKKGLPFAELTILHYQMLNGQDLEKILPIAAAIELLVLSSDILDDFEDGDGFHELWFKEQSIALNASTAMIFVCMSAIRQTELTYKESAISILLEYSLLSISGQHRDLLRICKTEKEYLEMVLNKSGSLVSLACLIGASLACGQSPEEIKRYSQYIGLVGQLNNDLKDICALDHKNDLLNKKISLPIIYLLNYKGKGSGMIRGFYNDHVKKEELVRNQSFIRDLIAESGAIEYTEIIKRVYQNKIIKELQALNVNQRYVEKLLEYII